MAIKRRDRISHAKWAVRPWSVSDDDWCEMEAAVGRSLSVEQRGAISKIAASYLSLEGMERAAPFVDEEGSWLAAFREAAAVMHDVAVRQPAQGGAARSRLAEVQLELDQMLTAVCGQSFSIEQIAFFLPLAVDAVAKRARPPGIEEGRQWRILVGALDAKFDEYGWPRGIRKDIGGKSKTDIASPFVLFFERLQKTFPPEARRHMQGVTALAAALVKTRREISRLKSAVQNPPFDCDFVQGRP